MVKSKECMDSVRSEDAMDDETVMVKQKRGERSIDIRSLFGQMFTQPSSAKSRIVR